MPRIKMYMQLNSFKNPIHSARQELRVFTSVKRLFKTFKLFEVLIVGNGLYTHGRPEGWQGGICIPLDVENVLLTVLIILIFNNKWL